MGKNDESKKLFWEDDERFADLINILFGQGEEIVSAADLRKSSETLHMGKIDGTAKEIQKYRDVIREAVVDGTLLFLIGIENQEMTHYAMPARVMLLDALGYEQQLRERQNVHKKANDLKPGAEFLSGLTAGEQLMPVCTVTLYYGKEPWDGPRDLHGLLRLENVPEKLRRTIPNYPITLVEVHSFPDWEKFRTDLREVFGFIQCSEDKEKLEDFLKQNEERFRVLSEDTKDFLAYTTGIKNLPEIKNEEGNHDMCKAIDDMIKEGVEKKLKQLIKKKLAKGKSVEVIADELDEEREVIEKLIAEMKTE